MSGNVLMSRQQYPVWLPQARLEMSWHLVRNICFCCRKNVWKCPDVLLRLSCTFTTSMTDISSNISASVAPKMSENVLMSRQNYRGLEMSWYLIKNVFICISTTILSTLWLGWNKVNSSKPNFIWGKNWNNPSLKLAVWVITLPLFCVFSSK